MTWNQFVPTSKNLFLQNTNLNIGYSRTQSARPVDKTFTSVNCSAVKQSDKCLVYCLIHFLHKK